MEWLYEEPFKAIGAGTKTFTVDHGGNPEIISAERFKPAHLDLDMGVTVHMSKSRGRPRK